MHRPGGHRRGEDWHLLFLAQRRTVADLGLGLDLEGVLLAGGEVADGALVLVRVEVLGVLGDEGLGGHGLGPPLDGVARDDAVGQQVGQGPLNTK